MNATTDKTEKSQILTEDWEKLRFLYQDSMMADTSLAKLAHNMGTKWPVRGSNECPRKYIGYSLEELTELPEFYGKGNRLPLLFSILKETLAFDVTFCDMARHFDSVSCQENEALKSLQELEIPSDFPVSLATFTQETINFCQAEGLRTIGQLVEFSQRSAQSVVVGGEFRSFLNTLIQMDMESLRAFLPVREGESGLHLAEAIGHIAVQMGDTEAGNLIRAYKIPVDVPEWKKAPDLPKKEVLELIANMKAYVGRLFEWMPDQAQHLRHALASGNADQVRFFVSLKNPQLEGLALAIGMAAADMKPRMGGFVRRFIS